MDPELIYSVIITMNYSVPQLLDRLALYTSTGQPGGSMVARAQSHNPPPTSAASPSVNSIPRLLPRRLRRPSIPWPQRANR